MLFHLRLAAEKELDYEKTKGVPPTVLGDEWEIEEVKEMKENVDRWLEE
jgi:hypothetical protein